MLIMTGALIVAVTFESDHIARILGFTVAATWLLYEPLLVSMTGGTVGHHVCNIRVVDDRTGGNVSFGKAIVRMVIKTILGWFSFISMAVASRHQALHDVLTKSTVQIRNLAKARPHDFSIRREALTLPGMPSRIRRIVVIIVYLLGWSILTLLVHAGLVPAGVVSRQCLYSDACSQVENFVLTGLALGWLGVCALLLGLGWRGRLWGARARRQSL